MKKIWWFKNLWIILIKKFDVFLIDRFLFFVLCMVGFVFVLLVFCYVIIDVYKVWSGVFFYFLGKDECLIIVIKKMI